MKRRNRTLSFIHATIIGILAVWLCGCAHGLFEAKPDEETLREAVHTVWEARKNADWGTVYDHADLKFKENKKRERYRSSLNIINYEILEIEIDENDLKAGVLVSFETFKMARRMKISMQEIWVFENGKWRLKLSDRPNPFSKSPAPIAPDQK